MKAARRLFLIGGWAVLLLAGPGFGQAQETERRFLSGHGKDDPVPWRFFCTAGPQSGYWTNLPVPSNWELYGYGQLHYQTEPASTYEEQGRYQYDFEVPLAWSQRRVFLVFDGSMTDTHAEINGRSAGPDHQGSFYRFRYEVTSLLKFEGSNRLDVVVHKRSANESVNHAERQGDYWLFGGIFRPVYLEALPARFIQRVAIDARADGSFAMDVIADGIVPGEPGCVVEAQIIGGDGKPVGRPFTQPISGPAAKLQTRIRSPRTWTAESPNLYQVQTTLWHGNQALHRVTQRFGFRTMEVRDGDGLYVNGKRVILKGADRHSAWPDSGRCLSEAVHRLDIGLMKEMNMNAARMSHYPPDEQFLDLCDELGLYILDELAGWQSRYDTPTGRRLVEEMVERDVNHSCILFWDNGNEGGWNAEVDSDFGKWDPQQRRVLHPWTTLNGVNTTHYLTYEGTKAACEGKPMFHQKSEGQAAALTNGAKAIYMPTEFLHGLYDGGAGAGMEDYWELMRRSPYLGGGFVWALLDEGLKRPDTGTIDVAGNKAPDGILGPYRQKEASFFTLKELWSPLVVRLQERGGQAAERGRAASGVLYAAREQPRLRVIDGTVSLVVENRFSFTDAKDCKITWQLRRFAPPGGAGDGFAPLAGGVVKTGPILPGHEAPMKIRLPAEWKAADALAVRAADPEGRELWTWVWPLPAIGRFREALAAPSANPMAVTESGEVMEVKAGELALRFNRQSGMLAGVRRGTQEFSLTNGPRPAVGTAALTGLTHRVEGGEVILSAQYEGALESVTWRVRGNGWVQCSCVYHCTGLQDYFGVVFDYPEGLVKRKQWLGVGPYRVWKNRLRGGVLGVWENAYNRTVAGWSDWVYPEFKGCFGGVRWLRLETAEGDLTVLPQSEESFVQVLVPDFPPANLQAKTAVSLPKAGLAFLEAIPPMGDKFHSARDTGPQGQPNVGGGSYTNTVNIYFGSLSTGAGVASR